MRVKVDDSYMLTIITAPYDQTLHHFMCIQCAALDM